MLQLISKHRTKIMAFAILGILLTHSGAYLDWGYVNRLLSMGIGGVDFFFFLSGFGLYYSYSKDPNALRFYKKRFIRIMPMFLLVLLVSKLLQNTFSWLPFLKLASTIGFWFPKDWGWSYFAWFVSVILFLYLIFPLYYRFFSKRPILTTCAAIGIACLLIGMYIYLYFVVWPTAYHGTILFYARIPVFVSGVLAGFYSRQKREPARPWLFVVVAIVAFVVYFFWLANYEYRFLYKTALFFMPYFFIAPGGSYVVALVFERLQGCRILNKVVDLIGSSTLEAYLLINTIYYYKNDFVAIVGNKLLGIALMVLTTMVVAIILHYLMGLVIGLIEKGVKKLSSSSH